MKHDRRYDRTPLIVTWEVTQACGLQCNHCRASAKPEPHPDELTTEEGKALIDRIASFGKPAPILVFSGGDPLERADFFELIAYAVGNGLSTAVTPAPTSSLSESILDRFDALGVKRIALSLDGATAERHDGFRGERGSFQTIHASVNHANRIDLPIQINTTVTATTVGELPGIAEQVEAFGAAMWEVFFLVPIGRGSQLKQVSPSIAEQTLSWLYQRQLDSPLRIITVEAPQYRRIACQFDRTGGRERARVGSTGDGKGFIFVSHTGSIYPSGFLPLDVGDVRSDDLVNVYRNEPLVQALRDPDRFSGYCGRCPYRDRCGGSRARAFAATGDPLASDPLCILAQQGGEIGG